MRRLILWLNEADGFLLALLSIFGPAIVGLFGLMVAVLRVDSKAPISLSMWLSSTLYFLLGAGMIVGSGYSFAHYIWPRLVTWAEQPKIAPRNPGDAFLEAARREVDAIAPEHPDA